MLTFGIRESVREDLGFFRRAAYEVGHRRYSLDDIEHGMLRGNRRHFHPAVWFPQFAPDDPRLELSVQPPDPRVHCALVCASRSCPAFASFEPERLDGQLDVACRSFVNADGTVRMAGGRTITLSPIFRWYRRDFGGEAGVRVFVSTYLEPGPARDALRHKRCHLRYNRYDWSLNAA